MRSPVARFTIARSTSAPARAAPAQADAEAMTAMMAAMNAFFTFLPFEMGPRRGKRRRRGNGVSSLARLDDLVELLALDVGVDLHPQRQVVGQLEGERVLSHAREQVRGAPGEEVEDPALVGEALRVVRVLQDLVVALVLRKVRSVGLRFEGARHLQALRGQGGELGGRFEIEVADDDEILVDAGLLVALQVDPVG